MSFLRNLSILAILTGWIATPSLSIEAGGSDGGGGKVTRSKKATLSQIETLLPQMAKEILVWMNQYEIGLQLHSGRLHKSLEFLFLNREESNLHLLQRLLSRIDYRPDQYCSHAGNHRDASYNPKSNLPICVSGLGVSRSTSADILPDELFVLLIHEIAHALGADEAQAVAIQELAKADHRYFGIVWFPNFAPGGLSIYKNIAMQKYDIIYLRGIRQLQPSCADIESYSKLRNIALDIIVTDQRGDRSSALDVNALRMLTDVYVKFKNSLLYLCAIESFDINAEYGLKKLEMRQFYTKIFVNGPIVDMDRIIFAEDKGQYAPKLLIPTGSQIRKIENEKQLQLDIQSANDSLIALGKLADEFNSLNINIDRTNF